MNIPPITPIKEVARLLFIKTLFLYLKNYVNFKIDITEMYPPIPCKLVADPLGSEEHIMRTNGLGVMNVS
jgi:hypothetical protein